MRIKLLAAYENTKNVMINATLLHYHDKNNQIVLFTDVSLTACGTVLQQKHNDEWVPLGFYSKGFEEKGNALSTFTRELTAVYKALHNFSRWVEGRACKTCKYSLE